jgi:hypothetical protein
LRGWIGSAGLVLLVLSGCSTHASGAPAARFSQPAIDDDASAPPDEESPSPSPSPSPSRSAKPKSTPSHKATQGAKPANPPSGLLTVYGATFRIASGGTGIQGTGGRLLRYEVGVQIGLSESPADVAATVDRVLGNQERGWLHGGGFRFQRVSGGQYDFAVELATPGTTDIICGKYGIHTQGQVSCRGGPNVVLNSARWERGTNGTTEGATVYPPSEYRILVVNHEVGHFLGHGHVPCPGAGTPAPVMMPSYFGLDGCTQNLWPYQQDGGYLG